VYFLLLANAAQLVYISLLYYFNVKDSNISGRFYPVYALYIIVGVELLLSLPWLIYYISEQHLLFVIYLEKSAARHTCWSYADRGYRLVPNTVSQPNIQWSSSAVLTCQYMTYM